jgi:hypothetical protein
LPFPQVGDIGLTTRTSSRVGTKERPAPAKVKRAAEVDELLLDAVDEQQQSRLQIKMKNEAAN